MRNETKLAEIPFEDAEYAVFDFETTGTSARNDKVIEIGIVKVRKGKVTETFSSFINPGRPVPFFITQMTGITNSDVQDAPYFDEVYYKIKEFIGDSILTAHNLSFDHSFLKHECANYELEFPKNEAICTLRLARRLYPQLPSKSLGNLVKQLRIRHRDVHRGLGDASATAKILVRMFKLLREEHGVHTVTDLINFQRITFSPAPFTMIKKKLIDDLAKVPSDPGVYFFKNAKGEIIYIGKAKSLRERLRSYFLSNA
ncbi:MAG: exonuclease domain-containing protein, partial [Bacteroidetes bacterium]|nr:exonuclease domain-containing protein [Bacteroidota bacterium]